MMRKWWRRGLVALVLVMLSITVACDGGSDGGANGALDFEEEEEIASGQYEDIKSEASDAAGSSDYKVANASATPIPLKGSEWEELIRELDRFDEDDVDHTEEGSGYEKYDSAKLQCTNYDKFMGYLTLDGTSSWQGNVRYDAEEEKLSGTRSYRQLFTCTLEGDTDHTDLNGSGLVWKGTSDLTSYTETFDGETFDEDWDDSDEHWDYLTTTEKQFWVVREIENFIDEYPLVSGSIDYKFSDKSTFADVSFQGGTLSGTIFWTESNDDGQCTEEEIDAFEYTKDGKTHHILLTEISESNATEGLHQNTQTCVIDNVAYSF